MSSNMIRISLPTFVRFNVKSTNMDEIKKQQALNILGDLSTKNFQSEEDLSSNGSLFSDKDIYISNNINVQANTDTNPVTFSGRINLADSSIYYKDANGSLRHDYENVTSGADTDYVPYGLYKQRASVDYLARGATSAGHVGSGNWPNGTDFLRWNAFDTVYESGSVGTPFFLDPSDNARLKFTINRPSLLKLSVTLGKSGEWLDNGTGVNVVIFAVNASGSHEIGQMTSVSSGYYHYKSMCAYSMSFYTESSGYFALYKSSSAGMRATSFSWDVMRLPGMC